MKIQDSMKPILRSLFWHRKSCTSSSVSHQFLALQLCMAAPNTLWSTCDFLQAWCKCDINSFGDLEAFSFARQGVNLGFRSLEGLLSGLDGDVRKFSCWPRLRPGWRLETLSWSINSTVLHAQTYLVWLCVRPAFLIEQRHVGPKLLVQKQLLSMHFRSRHLAASQQSTPYATFGQHALTQHGHRFSLPFGGLGPTWAVLIYTLTATKTKCDLGQNPSCSHHNEAQTKQYLEHNRGIFHCKIHLWKRTNLVCLKNDRLFESRFISFSFRAVFFLSCS